MCKQYTVRAHVFLMFILPACLSQPVVTVVQVTATLSRTDSTHTRGSRNHGAHCWCLAPKQSHTNNNNPIWGDSVSTGEEPPPRILRCSVSVLRSVLSRCLSSQYVLLALGNLEITSTRFTWLAVVMMERVSAQALAHVY